MRDTFAGELIKEMVYALVHDFALHELVWLLRKQFPGVSVFLASDPAAHHDLRIHAPCDKWWMISLLLSSAHGRRYNCLFSRLNK